MCLGKKKTYAYQLDMHIDTDTRLLFMHSLHAIVHLSVSLLDWMASVLMQNFMDEDIEVDNGKVRITWQDLKS